MWTTVPPLMNWSSITMAAARSIGSPFYATSMKGTLKDLPTYVAFTDKDSVQTAMALDDSLFRGRQIKVMPKRTNKPGITSTNRPPRGRGGCRARGGRGRGFGGGYRIDGSKMREEQDQEREASL